MQAVPGTAAASPNLGQRSPMPARRAPRPGTPGVVLMYTTLATWQLLACPAAVNLSPQPVPAAELAADRAVGLRTGPVTVATAARTP